MTEQPIVTSYVETDGDGRPYIKTYSGFKNYSEAFGYARMIKAVCEEFVERKRREVPDAIERIVPELKWDFLHGDYVIEILLDFKSGSDTEVIRDLDKRIPSKPPERPDPR